MDASRKPLALSAQGDDPDDEVLILCPCFVWAFSFLSKRWYQYHVDDLVDVDFKKRSFERLVLREDYKTLLKSMVAQHFTQGQNRFRDLVAGKGQGLNILLHGPITLISSCAYAKIFKVRLELVRHSQPSASQIFMKGLYTLSLQVT